MQSRSNAAGSSSTPPDSGRLPTRPLLLSLSVQWDDCSVALGNRDEVASEVWSGQPEQADARPGSQAGAFASRDALLLLDRLLVRTDTALSDVDALCFARGPGAFTSLRVAAGLVQGLSLATSIPVIGICSLAALAAQDPGWLAAETPAATWLQLSAIDARMGECYFALHECRPGHHPVPVVGPAVGAPSDAVALFEQTRLQCAAQRITMRIVPAGNGFDLLPELSAWSIGNGFDPKPAARSQPTAAAVLAVAASHGAPPAEPAGAALPVYIRDKIALDVTEQRAGAAARARAGAGGSPA
jgi:tRNA threonylcarbamoyladenosine biosynthesis protein TsaB